MLTLKKSVALWNVRYTSKRKLKYKFYMAYGKSILDVIEQHIDNPKYKDTIIVGIEQIEDFKEWRD